MLKSLKASGAIKTTGLADEEFDLLVVGGGATGAGVAVDAASRGLKVALVERDDFSAGTSSKSTKLVHGGVRYLQKAVFELDYEQYKLVREALHERRIFLQTAPYLSAMLPIMLPIYKYWQIPYYWSGCKLYDILAGKENMETSYLMSKGKALETFPMLKSDGLVGAVVYYDGQHNDSRMNLALIMSAVKHGAIVANYCEVTGLHKNGLGKLDGARVKDNMTGEEFDVRAKGVINATGPFSDALLTLDNPAHKPIVQASAGIHITLPNYYSPRKMGLLDPATSDGRVIFFLPWQGNTIAGTTDSAAAVEREPRAQEEEIRWVLEEVRRYLAPDIKVRRGDVLSAWSGLRPLVRNPGAASTEGLVRNHMIHVSESGLLTIAGGKWTTYRAMAEETVDEAVKVFGLQGRVKSGCVTSTLRLVGSDGWSRNMFIGLIQRYGLETEVAKHLSDNYGDRAWTVCSLAEPTGQTWPLHGTRISPAYPFIEAEVRYAVRHEYALTPIDVLARRTRLSFLNAHAALEALPRIADIMASELHWSRAEKARQVERAVAFLASMGLAPGLAPPPVGFRERVAHALWGAARELGLVSHVVQQPEYSRARFDGAEMAALKGAFARSAHAVADPAGQAEVPGYADITAKDTEYVLEEAGFKARVDVDFEEFLEVCVLSTGLKDDVDVYYLQICGTLKEVSFAPVPGKQERRMIPVEKSGGGV
ncbi:Glycerol-3-phosphate dehydrogenase [Mycena sanguinolenta]|uniref:Glycerol-3-phosphate dehydrogenase n=1 Tax=Mycena sanguinolenta TaxID=230812 RepID=A0A8H6YGB4_9AGAR|nr:Glycerol-3-phosphate dehydrogenase [Mycena sanguinolenta]